MQNAWKIQAQRNEYRRILLKSKWTQQVKELIDQYNLYPRKNSAIIWKLQKIPERKRDELIKKYYWQAKHEYYLNLRNWIRRRHNAKDEIKLKASILQKFTLITAPPDIEDIAETVKKEKNKRFRLSPKNSFKAKRKMKSKFSSKEVKKLTQKQEEKPVEVIDYLKAPQFDYIPTKDDLIEMILRLANSK